MAFSALPPTGLLCQLLAHPEKTRVCVDRPRFGWIVNDRRNGALQSAYRILVASDPEILAREEGDVWDSGRVESSRSIDVIYGGKPLDSHAEFCWPVCPWNGWGEMSPWSAPQGFRTGEVSKGHVTARYPLEQTMVEPVGVVEKGEGHFFVDFGRAAFGT
ncbi:MAG: hypothetical protein HOC74_00490, partial [Gemmatimonadetes bacterium]|nr:hypothetical protein [Gemmatimonadota bacterium]